MTVTVPVSDTLSVRAAVRQSGMDGYIYNTNLDEDGPHRNDKIGRISARWTPSDSVTMDARLDLGHMRDRGVGNAELTGCPPDPRLGPATGPCARYLAANGGVIDARFDRRSGANPSFFDYDYQEAEWRTQIGVGDNTLTFTTGYFHHHSHLLNDVLPVPAHQGGSVVGTDYTFIVDTDERYRQFSQEIRFASPEDRLISYMAGAYYAHAKLDINFYQGLYFVPFGAASGGEYTAATPVVGNIRNRETDNVLSGFAALTVRPADPLRINLGLRYSRVRKTAARTAVIGTSGLVRPSDATFIPGNATTQARLLPTIGYDTGDFTSPRRTDDKLLPTASIQYDFTPDTMGYVSYAKGFKAGGYSVLVSKSEFGPESVDAFEAGVKSNLFGRLLTLNAAAFYSKYKGLQESTTINIASGGTYQIVANVASSISKGVELGLALRPTPEFTLSADVAYLDAYYQNYPGAPCTALQKVGNPTCVQDLSGKRRAFAPKWSGNVTADYQRDIGSAYKLSLSGSVYFSSFFYQQPIADAFLAQSGFAKIDARIGFGAQDGRWEVAVIAKNLTNKLTANYRQNTAASAAFQAYADPPRSVGVQLSFQL